ncbi:hypothetical protein K492DRAFT_211656 [Lichtheimia hyalospora FSU 10163]|nr:hypothetical protein K492DRAFT_211656 [Lichtheimia hyalospora FSU 10163]
MSSKRSATQRDVNTIVAELVEATRRLNATQILNIVASLHNELNIQVEHHHDKEDQDQPIYRLVKSGTNSRVILSKGHNNVTGTMAPRSKRLAAVDANNKITACANANTRRRQPSDTQNHNEMAPSSKRRAAVDASNKITSCANAYTRRRRSNDTQNHNEMTTKRKRIESNDTDNETASEDDDISRMTDESSSTESDQPTHSVSPSPGLDVDNVKVEEYKRQIISVLVLPLDEINQRVSAYFDASLPTMNVRGRPLGSDDTFGRMVESYISFTSGETLIEYGTIWKNYAAIEFYREMQKWQSMQRDTTFIEEDIKNAEMRKRPQDRSNQDTDNGQDESWRRDKVLLKFGGAIEETRLERRARRHGVAVNNTIADFVRKYMACDSSDRVYQAAYDKARRMLKIGGRLVTIANTYHWGDLCLHFPEITKPKYTDRWDSSFWCAVPNIIRNAIEETEDNSLDSKWHDAFLHYYTKFYPEDGECRLVRSGYRRE